ncbi:MAG: prepilin-type N-terminal cleavage/methylation domain-containing protein [Deltaproteobacteria bacterium]|nr:prepilin-type N-terminal cleavage/methylation domain-containing protein [Deltaproteobacteria bacterium]MBW2065382.1 prepilin-type N-terminal cleavage/methylation domain-containing protein [Deltaproteobacteria bacterium]
MSFKSSKGRSGFTLLEIMIAMVICAVVFSVIYSAYSGTFRNRERVESQANLYMAARIALERMVEDLESAYLPLEMQDEGPEGSEPGFAAFAGEETELEGRRADTLEFLSRAHVSFWEGERPLGIAKIIYRVRRHSDSEGFDLYRSDRSPFEGEDQDEEGFLLCEGLYSVKFSYHDEEGDAYEAWDSRGEEHRNSLPPRVSITLEFLDPSDPETPIRFSTSASLPVGVQGAGGKVS